MSDIIRLLPDAIANQIAAGEVIQRPASVVKELVENAVDAKATDIQVIIKDAGKALIKIVDNGSGMSETDARMSLERHATSKLRSSDDLFAIRSMGFRGEAIASIAAISQMELHTRTPDDEVGTRIVVEASRVKKQEPVQALPGTTIDVKNLFFNVPARRKFLKSNPVEFRHITDEFSRIALAYPGIGFSLHHNNVEIYRLLPGNLRQRVVAVLGRKYNEQLVPVSEETNYVAITGFVGKPEAAKKTRGDQFLFVNNRFIKSPYLHHAIRAAFDEMIATKTHPMYVVYLDIDPAKIDINVHPTKQQIKFEDEKLIYNYLRVSTRHALGKYSVTPSLDFDQERAFNPGRNIRPLSPKENLERSNIKHWDTLYEGLQDDPSQPKTLTFQSEVFDDDNENLETQDSIPAPFQLHNTLLISQVKSGAIVIDQQAAHERILYERLLNQQNSENADIQKILFPLTLELSPADASIFSELLPVINSVGFEVESFGQGSFIIHGTPAILKNSEGTSVLQNMLEQYKNDLDPETGANEKVAKALSLSSATKRGTYLTEVERQSLVDVLFACENPYTSPSGRKCYVILELDELLKRLNKD